MDFTFNTIMGGQDCYDYANLVMRSCLFVTRSNSKMLSLGRSFNMNKVNSKENLKQECEQKRGDEEVCVVSFQKKALKRGVNRVLGSGLITFLDHREQENNTIIKSCDNDDDDETASTVDMDEDEFQVSGSSSRRSGSQQGRRRTVHFDRDLVTAVYTRPRTTKEDKYYLHYDEYDYMDFRLEYRDALLQQKQSGDSIADNQQRRGAYYRRSPRKVSFKRDVVDSVHPVMDRDQRKEIKSDLFYTEEEMRSFLDEFVASLQKQSMQQQGILSS